jgi:Bacterial RNA polymerase, alpha chain C terminal domain
MFFQRIISSLIVISFFLSTLGPLPTAHGSTTLFTEADTVLGLPAPGTMVNLSTAYTPALIKGLTVHKDNPFLFDFILDTGNDVSLRGAQATKQSLKKEGDRLVKYFFACLTIPEKDLWVNLSPYEKDRMVPQALGQTALGRDLLAQDYILKQLTASLIYPEKDLGKAFWDRVYAKARQMYGTTQIPVNTFNKVWIVADKASVYEHGQTAFVVSGHLKVMLEEDYLALVKNSPRPNPPHQGEGNGTLDSPPLVGGVRGGDINSLGSQIVRAIILPEIEKEVNTGKNFVILRQIFNSLILATWYKKNLKEALLTQVYADKSTVKGMNLADPSVKEQIYQQYLRAYKKGVFNYIKEDAQPDGQTMPRKYFSGGFDSALVLTVGRKPADAAEIAVPTGKMLDITVATNFNNPNLVAIPAMTTPGAAMLVNNEELLKHAKENLSARYAYRDNRKLIQVVREVLGILLDKDRQYTKESLSSLMKTFWGFINYSGNGVKALLVYKTKLNLYLDEKQIKNDSLEGKTMNALLVGFAQATNGKNLTPEQVNTSFTKFYYSIIIASKKPNLHEVARAALKLERGPYLSSVMGFNNVIKSIGKIDKNNGIVLIKDPGVNNLTGFRGIGGISEAMELVKPGVAAVLISSDLNRKNPPPQAFLHIRDPAMAVAPQHQPSNNVVAFSIPQQSQNTDKVLGVINKRIKEELKKRKIFKYNLGFENFETIRIKFTYKDDKTGQVFQVTINHSPKRSDIFKTVTMSNIVGEVSFSGNLSASLPTVLENPTGTAKQSVSEAEVLQTGNKGHFIGQNPKSVPINDFIDREMGENLSIRLKRALSKAGFATVADLIEYGASSIVKIKRVGKYSVEALSNALHKNGWDWKRQSIVKQDAAMASNSINGGIDLNTKDMSMSVRKDGAGIEFNADPAMIERVTREGVNWLSPVILKITPVTNIWPLVGLQTPAQEDHF